MRREAKREPEPAAAKLAERARLAFEATRGLPTDALKHIAACGGLPAV